MLLSVVIPHYNIPRKLLTACIDSIMGQGIPDDSYEIIIIDDESEEFPEWVCNTYSRHNIRLIRNPHGGPGAARNRGIDEAKGRYIQFVDADDYLLQNGQMAQSSKRRTRKYSASHTKSKSTPKKSIRYNTDM